jgi:transcriptional regulator with XRE-family HTH domain
MTKSIAAPIFPVGLLAKLREKRGWTQEEVAKAVGTSRPNYANIERGSLRGTLSLATRIARFYGVGDPAVVFTKTLIDNLSPEQRCQLLDLIRQSPGQDT